VSEFVASGISTFDENPMQIVRMNQAADENPLELFLYAIIQILTAGIYAK
jgi:hypothetical protein